MRTLRIKHFIIIPCDKGYIVHNTKHHFDDAHTHIKNHGYCKRLIYNVLYKRKPKTKNLYLLESHRRIADDNKYIQLIDDIEAKVRQGKEKFVNVNRGPRRG